MKRLGLLLLLLGLSTVASAQLYPTQYRPGNLDWQQLKTPHFKIVYPEAEDSLAWRSGQILEAQYHTSKQLVGGSLKNFPVIINNYNDRSNGFVTSLHFRSEIDAQNFKGKSLSPRSGSWLETVLPHELVHAMQFSNTGGFGLAGAVNLFSPDLARSFHGAIPSGHIEGLAVHHETENVAEYGGRGNYPYFTNQFEALFNSDRRWSMGQMSHVSSRTRPLNRHYIGGYEFTSWLQKNYGEEASRKALDFYIDWPFLGYGFALKHSTGDWPGQLYDEFEEDHEAELETGSHNFSTLPIPYNGVEVHRPKWIDESTLIFHGRFYNAETGFYKYDLDTQKINRLISTHTVQDYAYDLSEDRSKLVFAYNEADRIFENTFSSRLAELDLENGKLNKKEKKSRFYAPQYWGDSLLALEHRHDWNRLIATSEETEEILFEEEPHRLIEMAVHPADKDQWAVVANKNGLQGLWIVEKESIEEELREPPLISFEGASIFDPEWHPDEDRVMFSADVDGSMNVYEYDLAEEKVIRLTDTRFNTYEASYNPAGDAIAFIQQVENEQKPVVASLDTLKGSSLDQSAWQFSSQKESILNREPLGSQVDTTASEWSQSRYSDGLSWLKPRVLLPTFEEIDNRDVYQAGIGLHSNSLLQDQAYSLELSYAQNRFWYDFSYRNKQFYPGFKVGLSSSPGFTNARLETESGETQRTFLTQRRNYSLSVPARITLKNNIEQTSFFFEPEFRRTQLRYFELDHNGDPASDFANLTIANLYSSFSYRLQQNLRDVQPNSGATLFSELEYYLSSDDLLLETLGQSFRRELMDPWALRAGAYAYMSPLKRWNQSLRLGALATRQSNPVFSNNFLVSNGFSEPIFSDEKDLLSLNARYTVPVLNVDEGGLLLPLYLSNVYLVGFANAVGPYQGGAFIDQSRTVVGGGIRAQFRISNLSFDIGVGIGYEPATGASNIFIDSF